MYYIMNKYNWSMYFFFTYIVSSMYKYSLLGRDPVGAFVVASLKVSQIMVTFDNKMDLKETMRNDRTLLSPQEYSVK